MKGFADLHSLGEDDRIAMIAKVVIEQRMTCAVCVDSEPGKADRYIRKFNQRFPDVQVLGKFTGPVEGVTTIKVGPWDSPAQPKEQDHE